MDSTPTAPRDFALTRWSLIRRAGEADADVARAALEELCRAYWLPLYAFARRSGHDAHRAEDLVQGFFADLIARRDLERSSAEKGRFRSFLLAALQNFVSKQRAAERALKRGGGAKALAIDAHDADERLGLAAPTNESPERAFERAWARELLDGALDDLEREYAGTGRRAVFDALKSTLQGESYDAQRVAAELGATEGAVKVAAHRLRTRFGEALRARIAQTVTSSEEVEAELRELLRALSESN